MEVIVSKLRGAIKLVLAIGIVLCFFARAFILRIKHRGNQITLRKDFSENSKYFCGLMAKMLNVEIVIKGAPVADTNYLLVSNHMGFVDIFVLASLQPALFITSQEMRERPLLGDICELAGCIFVERRSRLQIMNELGTLVEALQQGFNVVLYPEATSSDGVNILPFKKTLMMGGPQAGRPIQPVCINFLKINGEDFSVNNRNSVCWYGDISFATSIWGSLTAKSIKAEVSFLEPIYAEADADRGEIANRAYNLVTARFKPAKGSSLDQESMAVDQ